MDSFQIRQMQIGIEMDAAITIQLKAAYAEIEPLSWSQDIQAAMKLRELITGMGYNVSQSRYAESADLQEICEISNPSVTSMAAELATNSWIMSLCKSFLLFRHGMYGQHMYVDFEGKPIMVNENATAKIYQFPLKKE